MQESNNIESNSSGESKQKTVSDGGVMMINGLKIISIDVILDQRSISHHVVYKGYTKLIRLIHYIFLCQND